MIIAALLLITASVTVTAAPTTNPEGCDKNPPKDDEVVEGRSIKTDENTYFYIPLKAVEDGTEAAEKMGFWEETNKLPGLQTQHCWKYELVRVYRADTQQGLATP